MPVKHYEPEAIAHALELVSKGRSYREAAAELAELGVKVSHVTVRKWHQAAPPAAAPTAPVVPEPWPRRAPQAAENEASEPEAELDFEEQLQAMITEARAEAKAYDQQSNSKASQSALKRASDLMKVLAQIQKRKPVDPDTLTFSKTEIDRTFAELEGLLTQLCARGGPRCVDCERALSVKFGRGQT